MWQAPHKPFSTQALAEIRPVPPAMIDGGSGEIGPLPRRPSQSPASSNMLNMSFLLAPNSGPIRPDQTHN